MLRFCVVNIFVLRSISDNFIYTSRFYTTVAVVCMTAIKPNLQILPFHNAIKKNAWITWQFPTYA